MSDKTADTRFPIHPLLAERWSPRAFDPAPVDAETVGSLFEAARWASSCFNEQPWAFCVATADDAEGHARLASCLMAGNASWASKAPVLVVTLAKAAFGRNGRPNRHAFHDVGLAVGNLVVEAQSRGLGVHQMAGFDSGRARETLGIPDGWEAVTMLAIGRPGSPDDLPDDLAARERAARERHELGAFVFGAGWGSVGPVGS